MSDKPIQPDAVKRFTGEEIQAARDKERARIIGGAVQVKAEVGFGAAHLSNGPVATVIISGGDPEKLFAFGRRLAVLALEEAPRLQADAPSPVQIGKA